MEDKLINEELVILDLDVQDFESLIKTAGAKLEENGKVRSSYIDAVIAREKIYPTGLITSGFNIGMPHTDPEHVISAGVCFVRTKHPIEVSMMGDPDTKFKASMFFVLAISNPEDYMKFLSQLMGLFQNNEGLKEFNGTQKKEKIIDVISQLNI